MSQRVGSRTLASRPARPHPRRQARRHRGRQRLVATVRGLTALVALAGFLVGVPLVLVVLQANPLPDHVPDLPELIDRARQILTGPDDGTLLLAAVRTLAWASWAVFAVSVAVEAGAAAAGQSAPALRGLAGMQRPAAYLVAVIAATITSPALSAAAAAAAPPAQAAPVAAQIAADNPAPSGGTAVAVGDPARVGHGRPSPGTATAGSGSDQVDGGVAGFGRLDSTGAAGGPAGWSGAQPGHRPGARRLPVVEVGRYDSLWRIAERHLGDGRRWTEIYRLNTGRTQPDSGRLTDPDHVEPGWTLILPADAHSISPDRNGSRPPDNDAVVVRPGDTLSSIAAQHLDTPGATRALFDANVGRVQPDGDRLTDPDLLRPGWRLTLPATAPTSRPTTPPATTPPATIPPASTEPPPPAPRQQPPTGSQHETPAPRATTPPTPAQTSSTAASSTAASSTPASSTPASSASSDVPSAPGPGRERADRSPGGWVQLPSGSVLGLGLITLVAGLLELLRRRRRQHRIPGDPSDPNPDLESSTSRPGAGAASAAEEAWMTFRRQLAHPDDTDDPDDELLEIDSQDDGDMVGGRFRPPPEDGDSDGYFADSTATDDAGPADDLAPRPVSPSPVFRLRVSGPGPAPDLSEHEVVARRRGISPGGFPAPSLLALIGPPATAPIAQRAWAGGIGLTGPGADGAARAIAARLLTATGPMGAELITTEAAIADLLPTGAAEGFAATPGVTVFPTLREALAGCESELLARARWLVDHEDLTAHRDDPAALPVPAVLLLAHAPTDTPADAPLAAHTDAVLQLGAPRELGAVLLGRWPQATLTVAGDGTLSGPPASRHEARTPGPADTRSGRAELLTAADAADLLAGLLPPLRDALDLLDPMTLLPSLSELAESSATSARADVPLGQALSGGVAVIDSAGAGGVGAVGVGSGGAPPEGRPVGVGVLEVAVFGRVRLLAAPDGREVTGVRAKILALLALLAVHPDGLTSDQVGEALWPGAPPDRVPGRLSATLALTRRLLRDAAGAGAGDQGQVGAPSGDDPSRIVEDAGTGRLDLVPLIDSRYQLHPTVLTSDYQRFTAALTEAARARRDGDDAARRAALRMIADLYRSSHGGVLAGIDYSWAIPVRERLRRQATDALATLATLLAPSDADHPNTADPTDHTDALVPEGSAAPGSEAASSSRWPSAAESTVDSLPEDAESPAAPGHGAAGEDLVAAAETLEALEAAIEVDPYNEELYRQVMRLHAAAGRREDVYQTLRLLEARLLDIDAEPQATTSALLAQVLRASSPRPARGRRRPERPGPTRTVPEGPTADRAADRDDQ